MGSSCGEQIPYYGWHCKDKGIIACAAVQPHQCSALYAQVCLFDEGGGAN